MCASTRGRAKAPVKRVGRELGGMPLGGAEPAELQRDLIGADARRLEQRRSPHQRDDGAPRCDRRAAAVGVKARRGDPALAAVLLQAQRDADQIAARGSAGGAGERALGALPAAERVFQMVCQVLPAYAHPSECRARSCVLR